MRARRSCCLSMYLSTLHPTHIMIIWWYNNVTSEGFDAYLYTQHSVCNYKNYCIIYVIYVAHLSIYVSDCSIVLSYSSQALIHTLVYHTGFGLLSLMIHKCLGWSITGPSRLPDNPSTCRESSTNSTKLNLWTRDRIIHVFIYIESTLSCIYL